MTNRIKDARLQHGWSQTQLITELTKAGARKGTKLPSRETLKSRVSRWENGRAVPDDFYRSLLREVLGRDDVELGFVDAGITTRLGAEDELKNRLSLERVPDPELLSLLAGQTEAIRRMDRQYGAGQLLEQMRGHVAHLEDLVHFAAFDAVRAAYARLLADAAALAAWQALDLGGLQQSYRLYETANRAASAAGDRELHAFVRMEMAHVLADLGYLDDAAQLAHDVWGTFKNDVGGALRCWLVSAVGEMLAHAGKATEARSALALAERLSPALDGDRPTYLVFNDVHLHRWTGHSLAMMGDVAADSLLRQARSDMDKTFTRAAVSLGVDLAQCALLTGDRERADIELRDAEASAHKIGSLRQLGRVATLRREKM
ncbi:helix-turn-helix domain-containing protein [Nocardioidaceae bacterium]|nr:helix-turn-helix domain-containing protein [Nocardioidaceae bacterium]